MNKFILMMATLLLLGACNIGHLEIDDDDYSGQKACKQYKE